MSIRLDAGRVIKKPYKHPQGHLRADAYATRTGVFRYYLKDGTYRDELRHPDQVFDKRSLNTLGGVPITISHPKDRADPTNFDKLGVGVVGDSISEANPYVQVSLNLQRQDGIDALNSTKQVSLVYETDVIPEAGVWEGKPYTHRQIGVERADGRYIVYRELGLVDRGRAGEDVRVHLDSADEDDIGVMRLDEFEVIQDVKEKPMATLHLDSISFEVDANIAQAVNAKIKQDAAALADLQAEFKAKSSQFDTLLAALQKAGYQNADEVITALDALKAELDKAKGEATAATAEADKAKAEVGQMQEAIAKKDAMDVASKIVPAEVKLDSLDSLGIKKAVISHKYPGMKLDGLSPETIEGMWTVATRTDSTVPLREAAKTATETKADTKEDAAMSARDAMSARRMKKKGVA